MTDGANEPHPAGVDTSGPTSGGKSPTRVVGVDVNEEGAVESFSAGKAREGHRTKLSWAIIAGLGIVALIYIFTALAASEELWERASWPIGTVLTAFVGLAGTTVGYYFGTKDN